jgi:spore maturation protein CgeB
MSRLVVLGLSLSSSWGNGHATTWRALLKGLAALGHEVDFLERDRPWYAANRDLPDPGFARLHLYDDPAELDTRFADLVADADAVLVGSYVPDGPEVIRRTLARARGPVAFYDIDTPVTLAALGAGTCAYLDAFRIPAFATYFSFAGGPVLERLERAHGARRAVWLPCGVDPDLYRPRAPEPGAATWDLGYLGTYSPDRQPALKRLLIEPARRLPTRRFVVAGPQYPAGIDWPANVERIEHLAPAEHPAFYGACRFSLNVTRADMVATGWAPSVRLFETAACGTPAISDRWPGLDASFPVGEAILVADTPEAVVAALAAGPDLRERLAARARDETLARHTGRHRAETLLAALDGAAAEAAAPHSSLERTAAP